MHVGKRKDASLWRAHGVDVDEVEEEARVCLGVLSYIGLSRSAFCHPYFTGIVFKIWVNGFNSPFSIG